MSIDISRLNSRYSGFSVCPCGSSDEPFSVSDSRGIYIALVCETCADKKLSGYRNDVLYGPTYETDEQIEEID